MESLSGARQVSTTARRHGVARSQLLAWHRSMLAEEAPGPGFVPAMVVLDVAASVAATASREAPGSRIDVVLRSGRRIIIEGGVDMEAVLKLARGLEALR